MSATRAASGRCLASGQVAPFVVTRSLSGHERPGAVRQVACNDCQALVTVTVAADGTATVPEHTRPVRPITQVV